MRNTFVIAVKDIKGFLTTPTFYVVAFLCAVVLGSLFPIHLKIFDEMTRLYMYQPNVPREQLNIHYGLFLRHLSYVNLILIFLVPALTMKLISEEKKLHTYDLLLTSPVSSLQIIMGKFLAGYTVVLALLFISFLYPVMTLFIANFSWSLLIGAYLGVALVAAIYTSMNLFCSSLTQSALAAFVMSVILNVSVWFIGIGAQITDSQFWRSIFEHVSINSQLTGFIEGNLKSSAIIFFLSVIFLFGFLAERVVESSRWR